MSWFSAYVMVLLLGLSQIAVVPSAFSSPDIAQPKISGDASSWNRGKASFSGQVLGTACVLAMEDAWQAIDMGMLPARDMQTSVFGPKKIFYLRLENCGVMSKEQTDSSVTVSFDGMRGKDPDRFSLTGQARGIELQIQDSQGYPAYVGEAMPPQVLTGEGQHLQYSLRLVRNADPLQTGDYYAAVRLKVDYE